MDILKVRDTLTEVRREYWIPQGRNYVRKLLKDCRWCKRFDEKSYCYPNPPPLPSSRLKDDHAFSTIGIDYAGPLHLKNVYGDEPDMYKAWISLITCATTRGVHLDLASNLTGAECIQLLKRFISRRGAPNLVLSDNGKSFIAEEVQNFVSSGNISWNFNLEAAPWQGVFFERLVQSVKRVLKKVLSNSRVKYNEMLTILCEVESILNNRPMTYIYEGLTEHPLTPNHLIFGRTLKFKAQTFVDEVNQLNQESAVKRKAYVDKILSHFWNRWRDEYILELREHHKNKKRATNNNINVSVGDVVLIINDNLPRSNWRLGRIAELIIGRDKQIRGAIVKTRTEQGRISNLRRPVNKLVPLELCEEKEEIDDIVDIVNEPIITFIDELNIPSYTIGDTDHVMWGVSDI